MPEPTNKSLQGIIDWARMDSLPGVDPTPQDINADRVDGMHAAQIIAAASAAGGGGVVATGLKNFVGNSNGVLINAADGMITLPSTEYQVSIMPEANTNSRVGEVWIMNKTNSSFVVHNAGSGTTQFRWAVSVKGQMPDLAGAASGDIFGNYPGPIYVSGFYGRALAAGMADPTTGHSPRYNGANWVSDYPSIGGRDVSSNVPSNGDVLTWNGSMWVPQAPATSGSSNNWNSGQVAAIMRVGYSPAPHGSPDVRVDGVWAIVFSGWKIRSSEGETILTPGAIQWIPLNWWSPILYWLKRSDEEPFSVFLVKDGDGVEPAIFTLKSNVRSVPVQDFYSVYGGATYYEHNTWAIVA